MEKRQLFRRFGAFGLVAASAMPFDDALFPGVVGAGPHPNSIKPLANGKRGLRRGARFDRRGAPTHKVRFDAVPESA
jgi:hypothetical protein